MLSCSPTRRTGQAIDTSVVQKVQGHEGGSLSLWCCIGTVKMYIIQTNELGTLWAGAYMHCNSWGHAKSSNVRGSCWFVLMLGVGEIR